MKLRPLPQLIPLGALALTLTFFSLILGGPVARAEPASPEGDASAPMPQRTLTLVLPGGIERETFGFFERTEGDIEFLYEEEEQLAGIVGAEWAKRLARLIPQAKSRFESAQAAGLLPFCDRAAAAGRYPVILLKVGKTRKLGASSELYGFHHRENPGPMIEAPIHEDPSVERIILHEMAHAWCRSGNERPPTAGERWLEEGVADWIAYAVLDKAPQLALTRYLRAPCAPTSYGSSFLWVLSRMGAASSSRPDSKVVDPADSQRLLAELHIGRKAELGLFGHLALEPGPACDASKTLTPFGQVLAECPKKLSKNSFCLPLWRTPWGEVTLDPPANSRAQLSGVFAWTPEN